MILTHIGDFPEEILIANDEPHDRATPSSLSSKSEKRHMYVASWQGIVRARRGGSKATINVTSASRGGLELFYARGGGRFPSPRSPLPTSIRGWRDALRPCITAYTCHGSPHTAARLHNRYPAYTCVSPRAHTCVRGEEEKKAKRVCVRKRLLDIFARLEYSCHTTAYRKTKLIRLI